MYNREWQGNMSVNRNQPNNKLKWLHQTDTTRRNKVLSYYKHQVLLNVCIVFRKPYTLVHASGDGNDSEKCFGKSNLLSYSHSFVGVNITSIKFQSDTTPNAHCIRVPFLYSCTPHYHSLTWQPVCMTNNQHPRNVSSIYIQHKLTSKDEKIFHNVVNFVKLSSVTLPAGKCET